MTSQFKYVQNNRVCSISAYTDGCSFAVGI